MISKIMEKKEFSRLPKEDVLLAFGQFDKKHLLDGEKIKKTRDLLRKVFSGFTSQKLLSPKEKTNEWILRKHLSTRERLGFYEEIYGRILGNGQRKQTVIDFGSGINGFSYPFFKNAGVTIDYFAIEAVGQLVELMNSYFKKNKLSAKAISLSLFDLKQIFEMIKKTKKPRVAFLFKVVDSLEMLKRNYSKDFILEISRFFDKIILSFPTESMIKRKKFNVNRNWIFNFIRDRFEVLDEFALGSEKFIVFSKRKNL